FRRCWRFRVHQLRMRRTAREPTQLLVQLAEQLKNLSHPASSTDTALSTGVLAHRRAWTLRDFLELTKPEIAFLVGISVLAGFLTGAGPSVDWIALAAAVVGTIMASGGAGALNHYYERRHDARMHRTANRPIPSGRVSPD